ncbi:helix-turn-helix domain-containing protein [Viscerimonas tarda]
MAWNSSSEYERLFKLFMKGALCFHTVRLIILLLLNSGVNYVNTWVIALIFVDITAIIVITVTPSLSFIQKLKKIYIWFMIVAAFPLSVYYFSANTLAATFDYINICICGYILFFEENTFKWVIQFSSAYWLLILGFVSLFIYDSSMLYDSSILYRGDAFIKNHIFDTIEIAYTVLFVCFCLYFIHRFRQMETDYLLKIIQSADKGKINRLKEIEIEEENKFTAIYALIEEYFKSKQPYTNGDFSLAQMANELNISSSYLSKAINCRNGMNFNRLVNSYRIEKAKELVLSDSQKYTMEYIYLSSGFKNHSSFNKAFKLCEGVTPSEYYKQHKK